jgi:hypothetical protein
VLPSLMKKKTIDKPKKRHFLSLCWAWCVRPYTGAMTGQCQHFGWESYVTGKLSQMQVQDKYKTSTRPPPQLSFLMGSCRSAMVNRTDFPRHDEPFCYRHCAICHRFARCDDNVDAVLGVSLVHDPCIDLVHFAVTAILSSKMNDAMWQRILRCAAFPKTFYRLSNAKRDLVRGICAHKQVSSFYRHVGIVIACKWDWLTFERASICNHPGAKVLRGSHDAVRSIFCQRIVLATQIPACVCNIILEYFRQDWIWWDAPPPARL